MPENADDKALSATGRDMLALAAELFPVCRSITGEGLRRSFEILGRHIPLVLTEIPTGTPVFDWTIPREWNIRGASIARLDGTRVVDFAQHNLHVVQYSTPIDAVVSLDELRRHIHTLPDHPDWIPYRTSYYSESWGFCLTQTELQSLRDPEYRVVIDSSLEQGHLTYAECIVRGASEEEVLLSCHSCHPSLANDNLSGMVVAAMLARHLMEAPRRYTYRFLFMPGTIGSLAWLAHNRDAVARMRHGLVLSCLGDQGAMTYKQSRRGDAPIDRIVSYVLRQDSDAHRVRPFIPYGYDERQYCSPGFNLPVGCLMRTPNGEYAEYHSSADNLSLLQSSSLDHSLAMLQKIVEVIEGDTTYLSLNQFGEPQLGRRGLYGTLGGQSFTGDRQMALLWVMNLADGHHSLLDIAERSAIPFATIKAAADALLRVELLKVLPETAGSHA